MMPWSARYHFILIPGFRRVRGRGERLGGGVGEVDGWSRGEGSGVEWSGVGPVWMD